MRESPPQSLIDRVERLGLLTSEQVAAMSRRVRRLAGDLPWFESVWVDALAQARLITPYQASQINIGRGDSLALGPYVLWQPLPSNGYADCFLAREIASNKTVRLAIVSMDSDRAVDRVDSLESYIRQTQAVSTEQLALIEKAGAEDDRLWVASRHLAARTAGEWLVQNGRFPTQVALEIARQMLEGLVELEKVGLCHGDLRSGGLLLTDQGDIVLVEPGLRGVVRREEGFAHADLAPESYDYLAPERVAQGTPPTIATDIFALGAVWWHLLAGRPPIPGGNSLAKLQSTQTTQIADIRRLAPETPQLLAEAISACTQREANLRPSTISQLAEMLGPPTQAGRVRLAHCVTHAGRLRWPAVRTHRRPRPKPLRYGHGRLIGVAGCLIAVVAVLWSMSQEIPAPQASDTPETLLVESDTPRLMPIEEPTQPSDGTVLPASYHAPQEERHSNALILPSGKPIFVDSLALLPGQSVRGEGGMRPLVMVPREGLSIEAENVRFENVDFVWSHEPAGGFPASILLLQTSTVGFQGCSFLSVTGSGGNRPAAIRWTHPTDRTESELSLPSGHLTLDDCVFRNIAMGLVCETIGAVSIEMGNTLMVETGPAVVLDHAPTLDEPIAIQLSDVTLRASGPLLACRYERIEDQPGKIFIRAARCVLLPPENVELLLFAGPVPPDRLLRQFEWTGQGSLVSFSTEVARWWQSGGDRKTLDDTTVSIAGLIRGNVEFAGLIDSGPKAQQITRWEGPLYSSGAPGVDPTQLSWPRMEVPAQK